MMVALKYILVALLVILTIVGFMRLIMVSTQSSNQESFAEIIKVDKLYVKNGLIETRETDSITSDIFAFFLEIVVQILSFYFAYQSNHLITLSFMVIFAVYEYGDIFLHFIFRYLFHKNIFVTRMIRKAIITESSKCIKHTDALWAVDAIFASIIYPVLYIFGVL